MDEQFRSMSNESYREGLWDMVVHGIMMFSYHPVSKGIPPMVIDSPTDSIEIQALGVKVKEHLFFLCLLSSHSKKG